MMEKCVLGEVQNEGGGYSCAKNASDSSLYENGKTISYLKKYPWHSKVLGNMK